MPSFSPKPPNSKRSEPANSPRDQFIILSGWLPSLTFAFGIRMETIMRIGLKQLSWQIAMVFVLGVCVNGSESAGKKTVTLTRHETVAEFLGTSFYRCMGATSRCPDECGASGTMVNFRISRYLKYEALREGDPKRDRFSFQLEDNLNHAKVDRPIQDAVASLNKGDGVLLSWNLDYVTVEGSSGPQRPIVKLEAIAPAGTKAWMEQLDIIVGTRDALDHGPTIGSDEWMVTVSRKLGVYDAHGHGPNLHTGEWRSAVHRKAFGLGPASRILVVYRAATGKELRVTYDHSRRTVTLHTSQKDITLPQVVSASGARYAVEDEEFWNKGGRASYRKGGALVFEGNDRRELAEQNH
jgi:membrane-bound inhibitor of C-type lysozyme